MASGSVQKRPVPPGFQPGRTPSAVASATPSSSAGSRTLEDFEARLRAGGAKTISITAKAAAKAGQARRNSDNLQRLVAEGQALTHFKAKTFKIQTVVASVNEEHQLELEQAYAAFRTTGEAICLKAASAAVVYTSAARAAAIRQAKEQWQTLLTTELGEDAPPEMVARAELVSQGWFAKELADREKAAYERERRVPAPVDPPPPPPPEIADAPMPPADGAGIDVGALQAELAILRAEVQSLATRLPRRERQHAPPARQPQPQHQPAMQRSAAPPQRRPRTPRPSSPPRGPRRGAQPAAHHPPGPAGAGYASPPPPPPTPHQARRPPAWQHTGGWSPYRAPPMHRYALPPPSPYYDQPF